MAGDAVSTFRRSWRQDVILRLALLGVAGMMVFWGSAWAQGRASEPQASSAGLPQAALGDALHQGSGAELPADVDTPSATLAHGEESLYELNRLQLHGSQIGQQDSAKRLRGLGNGVASWYGPRFHGRLTANGERFSMHEFTAAHRTLPFGTRLRVTNESNGRSVLVRINDRGPYIKGRIIDLSRAAAQAIGLTGLAVVTLEAVHSEAFLGPESVEPAGTAEPTLTATTISTPTARPEDAGLPLAPEAAPPPR